MKSTLGKRLKERSGHLQAAETDMEYENHWTVSQLSHVTQMEETYMEETKSAFKVICKSKDTNTYPAKSQVLITVPWQS